MWGAIAAVLVLLPLVSKTVLLDESGFPKRLDGFALGYWLWVAAAEVNLVASLACLWGSLQSLRARS